MGATARSSPAIALSSIFRTTDITGTVTLPQGVDMVKPGDNVKIIGELIHPIAMEKGLKLAIREGGRTVASGQVIEIIA